MATDLSIINAALTRTGENPITSMFGSGIAEQIANQNYELLVESHLSIYPWKRATKIEQLARLDPDIVGEPPDPWTAAYQLPSDDVEIRTAKVGGRPIPYEVHGDTILCNAAAADEVILHYVYRALEADWPPWFREGMTRVMEAVFLRGIGERYREAELREQAAKDWWKTAKNRDAQSQPPRDPIGSPTLSARTGAVVTNPRMPIDVR